VPWCSSRHKARSSWLSRAIHSNSGMACRNEAIALQSCKNRGCFDQEQLVNAEVRRWCTIPPQRWYGKERRIRSASRWGSSCN
jgi:hypothetical protein